MGISRHGGVARVAASAILCLLLGASVLTLAEPLAPPKATQSNWVVEIVDRDYVERANSLALDSRDRPHIAYVNSTGGGQPIWIRYATKANGSWQVQTLEAMWNVEGGPSLAIDSQDRPWVAYPRGDSMNTQHDLRLARWVGSAWAFQTVQPFGVEAGWWPSLALDRQDRPRIAYYSNITDGPGGLQLVYAAWDDISWQYQIVFSSSQLSANYLPTSYPISLKLDSFDQPHIAEGGNGTLSYFSWDGTRWEPQFPSLPARGGESVSLALDSRDQPHIAYYDGTATNPKYVHWDGTTWVRETPVSLGSIGEGLSLVLDSSDEPHISYGHGAVLNPPPYYAYYVSKSAGVWGVPETVDPTEAAGGTSLALDSHGLPRMSYTMALNSTCCELRYASVPWVDTAPPTSQVLPISPYWNGNQVTAEATDESGVANVTLWFRYSADNSSWSSWTAYGTLADPPWEWSLPYRFGDGHYEFYSTAVDVAGNAEPPPGVTDAIAGFDVTPPSSSALPISPYWHENSPMPVTATAIDALSGAAAVTLLYAYAPDNATWGPWSPVGTLTSPPWSWSFLFPDGEGNYRFHTLARDVAGNVEGNKTAAEAIAGYRLPPDYAPVNPSPASPVTAGLSLPVTLSVDIANLGGTANATATLAFFNASTPASPFATFLVLPLPPGGTVGPFAATWVSPAVPGTYAVVADVDHGDAPAESNESNNLYAWTVNVVPGPVTTLNVGTPNYTASVTYVTSATPLSLSVLDQSGTGIRATRYRVDNGTWLDYATTSPFTLPSEGGRFVEWSSEDNAGNVEATRSAVLRVDDTPPTISREVGTPRYQGSALYVSPATPITVSATDGGALPVGIKSLAYRAGGAWVPYAVPFALSGPDGPVTVEYRAADLLGNAANGSLALVLDGTPPATTIAPGTGTYAEGTTFSLAAADGGSGVARTEYAVDGGPWAAYAGPLTLTVGTHTIAYRSMDRVDNRETAREIHVRVDGAPAVAVEVNWKPLVAAVFTTVLALAGAWSARRASRPSGTHRRLRAFALVTLPFVLAEIATGVVSVFTGLLAIPPLVGAGTAVDLGILVAGVVVSVYRVRKRKTLT